MKTGNQGDVSASPGTPMVAGKPLAPRKRQEGFPYKFYWKRDPADILISGI